MGSGTYGDGPGPGECRSSEVAVDTDLADHLKAKTKGESNDSASRVVGAAAEDDAVEAEVVEGRRVTLRDTGGLQREVAVLEGLAVLRLSEEALLGVVGARDREVGTVVDREVVGNAHAEAGLAGRLERGREQA